jgi:hypothetical protein
MKFLRTKLSENGASEYRIDGSTATVRFSRKVFQGGDPPMELEISLPENTKVTFAPPTRKTEAQKAKEKQERADKKAAEKKARQEKKAAEKKAKGDEMPSGTVDPTM